MCCMSHTHDLGAALRRGRAKSLCSQALKKPTTNDPEPDPALRRYDGIPDVRDGLTRRERVVLYVLHETQRERGNRNVPTAMLWGRVCEHFYITPEELSEMLARLGARK
jgi:hypothetical protein